VRTMKIQKARTSENVETPQKKSLDISKINQELNVIAEENRTDQIEADFATMIAEIEFIRNEEFELTLQQMANDADQQEMEMS